MTLCIEVQHAWLQWRHLAGGPVPNRRELHAPSRLVPRFVPDDERIEFGNTEVGERIDDVVAVHKARAHRKVDTAAECERLRVVWPGDGAVLHIGEGTTCHPLHGNGLDFHVLERADDGEVSLESVKRKSEAVCFDGFQLLELGENVDLGSHFADVNLECNEATEDGRELGLSKVIDDIRRRELHVGGLVWNGRPWLPALG